MKLLVGLSPLSFLKNGAYGRFMNRPYGSTIVLLTICLSFTQAAQAQFSTTAVYVGNQGNFTDANGTVSIYTPSSNNVIEDGIPNLNTLVQSITLHGDKGYVVANTSERVDVLDLNTNTRTGQITDVSSPRYLAIVDENKAYVSNLFSNSVTIIDLENNLATGSILVGTNPEDIAVIGDKAYVANNGFGFDSTLTLIDISTDAAVDTLNLGCDGPRSLEVDEQDDLWVFCNGKTVFNSDFTEIIEQTNGQVLVINHTTTQIVQRIELDAQIGAVSAGQDTHYDPVSGRIFLVKGNQIFVFDTTTNTPLETIDITGDENIGGVAFDAANNQLYLARITSFTTAGFVSIHGLDGTEISRFNVGIAPSTIALLQTGTPVAIEDADPAVPHTFLVHQNYPNPFNPTTTISFESTRTAVVSIKVYNILGIEVATLADRTFEAGTHELVWDTAGLPGGSYFYSVSSSNFVDTKQMTLLK